MEEYGFSIQKKSRQLGFHYYNDGAHFDDPSLDYWLPKLQAAGTRWLIVSLPEDQEIPENFIRRVRAARIEPILVLGLSISNPPSAILFQQRMAYFQSIGIHMVQFFNRPNMKSSWSADEWMKPALVSRFIKKYADYASICILQKIIPVFPLLEPGGDYWDLAFLDAAVKSMKKEYADMILPNLVFSVSAALYEHSLDWNKGGPQSWPTVIPYAANQVDQRGFFTYEWYQSLIRQVTEKPVPMVLMQAGQWSSASGVFDFVTKESKQQYLRILNLLQEVKLSGQSAIPAYVLACCLYKLPSTQAMTCTVSSGSSFSENLAAANEPEALQGKGIQGEIFTTMFRFLKMSGLLKIGNLAGWIRKFGTEFVTILKSVVSILARQDSISEYFLIPEMSDLFTEEQLNVIEQYVKIKKCGSGSSLDEALSAQKVILMSDPALYPAYILSQLRDRNCKIQTVSLQNQGN